MTALIFDMDGVIIDSNPVHREAWEKYNRRFGIETTEEMQERMYGKRNDQIVRDYMGAHLTDSDVFEHGAAKERLFRELMGPRLAEHIVPGAREFLARHQSLPMAVASNAEQENVSFVLQTAGLARFFRAVVDGHQVSNPKPAPDVFLKAAELLGAKPRDCVVFEDSYSGVQAGLAAGMRVIGLRTTHDDLPGTTLAVDNFLAPELEAWMAANARAIQ
ncbi:MAG TPA: HAD family phosphatase [Bryobacteraceae bacterium]